MTSKQSQPHTTDYLREISRAVLVALLYFVTARLSLTLTVQPAGLAAVWPPSGLLLATLILNRYASWPFILLGVSISILLANLSAGNNLPVSLGFAFANSLESILAATLLRYMIGASLTMGRLRHVAGLVLLAVIGSNSVTALIGAAVPALAYAAPFWEAWRVWWVADGLGMLLVGSAILAWAGAYREQPPMQPLRLIEAVAMLAALALVATLIFGRPAAQTLAASPYLVFPLLLWSALRFGPRGATSAALLLAVISVWHTVNGNGPFGHPGADMTMGLQGVQVFLLVEGLSTLTLAALTTERRQALQALARNNSELEQRVAERTAALSRLNTELQQVILEHEQAEQALRESDRRLGEALRVGRCFAFEWHVASDKVLRSANSAEILGLAANLATEHSGQDYFTHLSAEDLASVLSRVAELNPHNDTYRLIYRFTRPDQSTVILEETGRGFFDRSGQLLRLFGITADVTARERAAERAKRLQEVTAALSAARSSTQVAEVIIQQGLSALDAAAVSVMQLSANNTELEILATAGYTKRMLSPWQRFPLTADIPINLAVRTQQPYWYTSREQLLERFPTLESTPVHNNSFAALPLAVEGRLVGGLWLSFAQPNYFAADEQRYITTLANLCAQALDRSRLYEAEQQARTTAEAAVRLREQFLSIASHELKTPLTTLLGNAQILQRRHQRSDGLGERDLRNLSVIVDQAQRLNKLISMLLDVSRIESGQLALSTELIDLRAMLRRLTDELRPALTRHSLQVVLPEQAVPIAGDQMRLEQVFQNLIQNAVKYSPQGGSIRITLQSDSDTARVAVADQGIGIPAGELPQLFRRFYRASNTGAHGIAGMGIGLYVVREIVERHQGRVIVESQEQLGSVFTVILPRQRDV